MEFAEEKRMLLEMGQFILTEKWECNWKKIKLENKKLSEFLLGMSEDIFEKQRDDLISEFLNTSKNFVTWEELLKKGNPDVDDNRNKEYEKERENFERKCRRQTVTMDKKLDDKILKKLRLYENLHEKHNVQAEDSKIEQWESIAGHKFHPNTRFSRITRLKLTRMIIEAPINEGGCGLTVRTLVNSPESPVLGFFPIAC